MVASEREVHRIVEEVDVLHVLVGPPAAHAVDQHDVELAGLEPRQALVRLGLREAQLDSGMAAGELGDRVGDQRGAGRGEARETHASAAEARDGVELRLGLGQPGQDLVGVPDDRLAGVGEPDAAGIALDEGRPGLALEGRYLLRHRRLRVAELVRRGRERALRGHLPKDPHPPHVEHKRTLSRVQGMIV